jgi:DNA-binding PadR family transcriptional regulator
MGKDSFSLLREINRGREPHQTITYGRMMRALGDLKRAGYLDVRTRAVMNRYGKIRATVAIKKLTQKVFKELGISLKEIGLERERKLKNILKEKERTEKMTKEKAKEIHAFILAEKEKYHPKPIHQLFLDAKKEVSEENVKELQRLHPDLTPRELAMMLVARIKKKPPDP